MTKQLEETVLCTWEHIAKKKLPHVFDVGAIDDGSHVVEDRLELIGQFLANHYIENKEPYPDCKGCPGYNRCYEHVNTEGKVNMFGLKNFE